MKCINKFILTRDWKIFLLLEKNKIIKFNDPTQVSKIPIDDIILNNFLRHTLLHPQIYTHCHVSQAYRRSKRYHH